MFNIELDHHKGTQNYEGTKYHFYNKTFNSIIEAAKFLKNITPGDLMFIQYKSRCCVYDVELESVYYKNEWIYIPMK